MSEKILSEAGGAPRGNGGGDRRLGSGVAAAAATLEESWSKAEPQRRQVGKKHGPGENFLGATVPSQEGNPALAILIHFGTSQAQLSVATLREGTGTEREAVLGLQPFD